MIKKSVNKKTKSQWDIFWEPVTKLGIKIPKNDDKKSKTLNLITIILLILAVTMPGIGWYIGAQLNPHGWMSDSSFPFLSALIYSFMIAFQYWYITVSAVGLWLTIVIIFKLKPKYIKFLLSIILFLGSLVCAIVLKSIVQHANSSEFTA